MAGAVQAADFIRAHTRLITPPLVPEIQLHLAAEAIGLWEETERQAGRTGLPPPFWAFPWAGGQALARFLLDHPERAAGRVVLDMASGSGLVAIAAAMAGAIEVMASDTDPVAVAAIALNAEVNDVTLTIRSGDLLGDGPLGDGPLGDMPLGDMPPQPPGSRAGPDLVVVGDAFYQRELARQVLGFLDGAVAGGARVLVGDPGRAYLPRARLRAIAVYDVPVMADLEDAEIKRTTVWEPA